MALLGFSEAALSGAVVVPENTAIWDGYAGKIVVNDVDGYRVRWSAPIGVIDPRWKFSDCDGSIETTNSGGSNVAQSVASTSESGISGPDAELRFGKVADPDDAAKAAFILRRVETDADNQRSELSFSPTLTAVPRGTDCWIAFGIRFPQEWKTADAGDEVMVFQVHETADVGDDVIQAPIGLIVIGGGAASASEMRLWVRSNPNATTLSAATTLATAMSELDPPADQWQLWVIKLRSHWDPAQSPRLQAWRAVGNGQTLKVADYSGPNTYNNTALDFVKSGVYYYDDTWSAGATEKVLYHKGLYLWRDAPWIDQAVLMDFLRSI